MNGQSPRLGRAGFATVALALLLGSFVGWALLGQPRVAVAQIPDSGAQRSAMIVELQRSNEKLTEIATLLREIRDQQAGKAAAPAEKKPAKP